MVRTCYSEANENFIACRKIITKDIVVILRCLNTCCSNFVQLNYFHSYLCVSSLFLVFFLLTVNTTSSRVIISDQNYRHCFISAKNLNAQETSTTKILNLNVHAFHEDKEYHLQKETCNLYYALF